MADIAGTPMAQIILQGTQLLQSSIRARKQLELQREQFEQQKKEHRENLKLREENLELERKKLELETAAALAKAAGGGEIGKTDLDRAAMELENAAAEDIRPLVEGDPTIRHLAGWTSRRVENRMAEISAQSTNAGFQAQVMQTLTDTQDRMPPGQMSPRGPLGKLDVEKKTLERYSQILNDLTQQRKRSSGLVEQTMRQAGLPATAATPTDAAPSKAPPISPTASRESLIKDALDTLGRLPVDSPDVAKEFLARGRQLREIGALEGLRQLGAVLQTKVKSEKTYKELMGKVLRQRRTGEAE